MERPAGLSDRAWRGFDPRAAVPHAAAAAAVSAALLAGRWHLDGLSRVADRAGAFAVYALVLAVWLVLAAAVVYRAVTYTYRLTDRALLIDRGPLSRPEAPVRLADVTGVAAGTNWAGRWLGVGWVRVTAAGGRAVWLAGVRDPAGFARQLKVKKEK